MQTDKQMSNWEDEFDEFVTKDGVFDQSGGLDYKSVKQFFIDQDAKLLKVIKAMPTDDKRRVSKAKVIKLIKAH